MILMGIISFPAASTSNLKERCTQQLQIGIDGKLFISVIKTVYLPQFLDKYHHLGFGIFSKAVVLKI